MPKWKTLKGQILAGTMEDSQGERNTKEFLVTLCDTFNSKIKFPLNQQHDMSMDTVGYIDNFNVVPSKNDPDEWNIIGDVYFHDVDIDEALNGFSYSSTEVIKGDVENKQLGIYLPYPSYNDPNLVDNLLSTGNGIVVGAWKKKCADPVSTSLIISFALFITAPAYTNFWNNMISPLLNSWYENFKNGESIEFVQTGTGHLEETFGIYFLPAKGKEKKCLTDYKIINGLFLTKKHIDNDKFAKDKGVNLVRLIYSEENNQFELKSVEYQDGSIINQ